MKQLNQSRERTQKNKVRQGQYFVKSCIFEVVQSIGQRSVFYPSNWIKVICGASSLDLLLLMCPNQVSCCLITFQPNSIYFLGHCCCSGKRQNEPVEKGSRKWEHRCQSMCPNANIVYRASERLWQADTGGRRSDLNQLAKRPASKSKPCLAISDGLKWKANAGRG